VAESLQASERERVALRAADLDVPFTVKREAFLFFALASTSV
jgi:hypothetical protein